MKLITLLALSAASLAAAAPTTKPLCGLIDLLYPLLGPRCTTASPTPGPISSPTPTPSHVPDLSMCPDDAEGTTYVALL